MAGGYRRLGSQNIIPAFQDRLRAKHSMPRQNKRKPTIGAVSYLNTKPLVCNLREFAPEWDLRFDLPSRLADQLAEDSLDVALIPSVEFLGNPNYRVISNACIACRGPVLSVKLLSRVPMQKIATLALDEGSRTSVALVRILLKQRFGLEPQLSPLPIGCDAVKTTTDAVLLIGDRAMHPPRDVFSEVWDLGEEWRRWSELPFVFAMWVARSGVDTAKLTSALEAARDAGLSQLDIIAREESRNVGLRADECEAYLRDNLHFFLGPKEHRGLALFFQQATELDGILAGPLT